MKMSSLKHDLHIVFKPSLIGFMIFFLVSLYVGFNYPWMPELSELGHKVIMGFLIAIGLWIFKPGNIPYSVSGCLLMMIYLLYSINPVQIFSGFTSTAIWVLIPALFFGYAVSKTGLGKRVAYMVINLFSPSYLGIVIAWVIIGLLLSALTPSITVRVAIVMPIAVSCIHVCKIKENSKGSSLILLLAWAMAILPGGGWLTGSLFGPVLMGLFTICHCFY